MSFSDIPNSAKDGKAVSHTSNLTVGKDNLTGKIVSKK